MQDPSQRVVVLKPKVSSGCRSASSSAATRSATIPQNFFCSGLHALCGSCAAQAATVSGVGVGVDVSAVASNRRGSAWLGLGVSLACVAGCWIATLFSTLGCLCLRRRWRVRRRERSTVAPKLKAKSSSRVTPLPQC